MKDSALPPVLQRLQLFMDSMHLTAYQVNKAAGLCRGLLINAYTKHQNINIPSLEAILNAFPQLNANWLICGRGQMLCPTPEEEVQATQPSATQRHLEHLDQLQQQCITLVKTIQQLRQAEQAAADARLLDALLADN